MKIKLFCVIVLLALGATSWVQAQSFDKLWKEVNQAEKKGLPESVIRLCEDIYRKAEAGKNSPQMLKAYTWRMKYRDELTPDSFYVNLKGLEQWAQTTANPMDRAVLHSLIAGIYAGYARDNQWDIRLRRDIVDETPSSDLREWSANQFVQKVVRQVQEALRDSVLLLETSSRTYVPFVELGKSSEYYHHDLYHLLASRGITSLTDILPMGNDSLVKARIEEMYQNMINTYRTTGNQDALVLTTLDYLQWKRSSDAGFRPFRASKGLIGLTQDPYLAALNKLMAEYKSRDICAEVYLAKAQAAVNAGVPRSALQLCDEAIALYPGYVRINALKNLKQDILHPNLSVNTPRSVYPGEKMELKVNHKNLSGFTVNIYAVNLPEQPELKDGITSAFYKKHCRMLSSQRFALVPSADYLEQDTVFTLKTPETGLYVMQIVPDVRTEQNTSEFFASTRFKLITRRLPAGQYEIVALDIRSGLPIAGASLSIFNNENKQLKELTTNAEGKVQFPWMKEYASVTARKGEDTAMPALSIRGGYYQFTDDRKPVSSVTLLTDRSLYRPGQTVYVKGIAYDQILDSASVIPAKEYTVKLVGSNGQEIARKEVTTNDYGSFTTQFVLPSVTLNGDFVLSTDNGRGFRTIRVEDYKRPTFDITFDPVKESYRIGDRVDVKGTAKTFSGIALQNLPVRYTVTRFVRNWRLWNADPEMIASDTVMLNNDGGFTIPVLLEKDGQNRGAGFFYDYKVEASVTNVAGETQSSVTNLVVADRSLALRLDLPERICKDDTIRSVFQALNPGGQPVAVKGSYLLYPVTDYNPAKPVDEQKVTAKPVYTGSFVSNEATNLDAWKSLPSGAYKVVLTAKDDQGREVEASQMTILFSGSDTRPPVNIPEWYYAKNTEFDAAHPASFYFGTSGKDTYVMMDVFCADKQLESRILNLSDSVAHFEFPYKEEYKSGLTVTFAFVKEGQLYQQVTQLRKRIPDHTLSLKWDVFRDKLRPGQKEEWKLTIRTPQGVPAAAEMLATMYDASLDKIWKAKQLLSLNYYQPVPYTIWRDGYASQNYYYYAFPRKHYRVSPLIYDHFSMSPVLVNVLEESLVMGYGRSNEVITIGAAKYKKAPVMMDAAMVGSRSLDTIEKGDAEATLPPAADVPELRTDFAETAFFYPQLHANEQGEISISFTMPQSLTTWNFRGYAHTKNMMTGMLDASAVTSKEFMLTPNLPRFVRVGDDTSVAASIANQTGKNISGVVTLTLFDPMTEKVVATQKQKFTVEAGKTAGVQFMFTVSSKYELLGCRLVADGGSFSDGEQHLLPVLRNKENLTETLAMTVRGAGTQTFSLAGLFNHGSKTATDRRLTVEFTGNPAWYAVQSLPSLGLPASDNAISWATSYYANTLASYIMNAQPRIKAVFESWKLQGGNKESFLSNLQKNQAVKNILLQESPWVMEATTEEEQQQRIATLFDLNNIRNNNLAALTKLKELQLTDGSWTWYKGMTGSSYVTDFIVETNARLSLLTGKPLEGDALAMQQAAFGYLHKAALDEYRAIRKAEKAGQKVTGLSSSALKYMYLVAISDEKVSAANKEAYQYFLSKIGDTLASGTMATKAYASVILWKAGRKTEAQAFLSSLKQHLTRTEEMGMYFAFNENPYAWGGLQIPAHVDVMEAFALIDGSSSEVVEEMKVWLLKQKQTMQWNSPVATADAVYALLYRGESLLDNQGDVRIVIAGEVLETVSPAKTVVPGLGYVNQTFTQKKVVNAKNITVEKRDAGIAWGAVYAQYEEEIDQVTRQGNALNVDKKLYVERIVNNVRELQPVTAETVLSVGDKVVSRLTIRLDRAMDFVQLKEQRAACFEPVVTLSGYRWDRGMGYYVAVNDASTNFFFDGLGKGVYVLEYDYIVSRAGTYETGLVTIQSAYAPEYASHSASMEVKVKSSF